ncbi:hypothetical protein LCGC14_2332210, partial [marine sediment metagenome]
MLYDSDQNGFYETVFILDQIENGVYNVMSIGYNYDGLHDFIPYINPEQTFERINDATSIRTQYNTYYRTEWDEPEIIQPSFVPPDEDSGDYPFYWDFKKLDEINTVYNSNPSDGWIVKDQIIEIEK